MLHDWFVHSHISYGIMLYGLIHKTALKQIQTTRNVAHNYSPNRQHSVQFRYPLLNLIKDHQLLSHWIIIVTSKFLTNRIHCRSALLTCNTRLNYHLRSTTPFSLLVPQTRTNYGFFSFTYIATVTWNALAIRLTTTPSSYSLEENVRSYIL